MPRNDRAQEQGIRVREVAGAPQWGPASPGVTAWVEMESPDPEWDGYCFRAEFDHSDGALLSISVNRMTPRARPLTARRFREVPPIGRLEQFARRWIADSMSEFAAGLPGGQLLGEADWQQLEVSDPQRQRMLADVAALYVRIVGETGWLATMSEELGFSQDTIPNLINEARTVGILTKTTRGKGGGSLTEKGYRLLGSPVFDPSTEEYDNG